MGVNSSQRQLDLNFMGRAMELAKIARDGNEVPVGAVVVRKNKVIGEGYNTPISNNDPSAHAEIVALKNAGQYIKNYRMSDCALYVTLEPCIMCAGALLNARIARLIFATHDPKFGAAGSQLNLLQSSVLNHQCSIESGVLEQESKELIQTFFKARR